VLAKRHRKKLLFLGLLFCLLCSGIFAAPLLVAKDILHPADTIIVIGGDHKPERVKHAVDLYNQGYAPVVIISAGTKVLEGDELLPEAEVMHRQASASGLSDSVLIVEDESLSTFQNAYYTKSICEDHGFRSVLLVTSMYHSRRARRIFLDVFGSDISVSVQPAPQASCAFCWWFQPDQAKVVLYEYYSWGRYWIGIRSPREMPPAATGSWIPHR
jgi:uncharacterized SAM-binding protein YcdF (DUF218 family)